MVVTAHRPASIQDVAAAAAVSTATVSRVLNTPDMVSPATAERVNKAIAQLGYRPNVFAQGLMTRKSRVLGIALPDIHGEFYSELLRGADAEARRLGFHLLVGSEPKPSEDNGKAAATAQLGLGRAFSIVDGLAIMITEPNEALWKTALELGLPVVVVDAEIDHPRVDSILVDNAAGTREAVEHLLQNVEATNLYFVGGPAENFDSKRRADTFKEVLRNRGVKIRADQVAFGHYDVQWGRQWAAERMNKGSLNGCGVLAANDEIALGVLQAAQEAGVTVPKQLKVVGFDDTRLASLVQPTLSTVRVPLAEIGAAAVAALIRRIEEPDKPAVKTRLLTRLVVRESSTKRG